MAEIQYDNLIDYCINGSLRDTSEILCLINGVSDKTANKIIFGIRDAEDIILELENELTLIPYKSNKGSFKVCFTKIRDEKMEDYITSVGGQVVDSLTKDTNLVIIPMNGVESSKVTKAQKYGIPVIQLSDAEKYIKENFVK